MIDRWGHQNSIQPDTSTRWEWLYTMAGCYENGCTIIRRNSSRIPEEGELLWKKWRKKKKCLYISAVELKIKKKQSIELLYWFIAFSFKLKFFFFYFLLIFTLNLCSCGWRWQNATWNSVEWTGSRQRSCVSTSGPTQTTKSLVYRL